MSGNIYQRSSTKRVNRRGRGACAAAVPAASSLLPPTSPLYVRRLAGAVRRAIYQGGAYYCHTRLFRVRFHRDRIEYQPLSSSANSRRWVWAEKLDGFTDWRGRDVCASRELPRARRAGA
jgi:hypothetical protein